MTHGGATYDARPVASLLWQRRLVMDGLAVYLVDDESWARARHVPLDELLDDTRAVADEGRPPLHLVITEAARGVPARRPAPLDVNG